MAFIVTDIETTGFASLSDDIIQCAYVMLDNNLNFVRSDNLYFYRKGMSWSTGAEEVHQISQEFLKQYEDDFRKNLLRMYSVLNGATLVGHNIKAFDNPFITNWLGRMGLEEFSPGRLYDTMTCFRADTGKPKSKLTFLCDFYGLQLEYIQALTKLYFGEGDYRAHDARYDVTATALLFKKAVEKGFLSITQKVVTATSQPSINFMDMDSKMDSGARDPKGFFITLCESDQSNPRKVFVQHTENKVIEEGPEFPYKLVRGLGVFETIVNGVAYKYNEHTKQFTIDNGIMALGSDKFDMPSFITKLNNQKKE